MKKYLMGGIAAVAICAAFTSCSKSNELFDQNAAEQAKQQEQVNKMNENYEKAFINTFGKPSSTHTWGFGATKASTRGNVTKKVAETSTGINANANEWADPNKTFGGWNVPDPLTDRQRLRVYRYFQTHPNLEYLDPEWPNFFVQQCYTGEEDQYGVSTENVTAANGSTYHSTEMNELSVGKNHQHINNFNAGSYSGANNKDMTEIVNSNGTVNVLDNGYTVNQFADHHHSDQIMLMVNIDDTSCFGYKESGASVQRDDKMALVSATEIDRWANNEGKDLGIDLGDPVVDDWNRSFLGFDHALRNLEEAYVQNSKADYSQLPVSCNWGWDGEKVINLKEITKNEWGGLNYGATLAAYQYILKNGENIPYLDTNANFYVKFDEKNLTKEYNLNGNTEMKDVSTELLNSVLVFKDAKIVRSAEEGKVQNDKDHVVNLALVQKLVDDNYLPVNNSGNLSRWIKVGDGDGYFTDWIVTLTEAERQSGYQGRIMAEDLNAVEESDFDFNDVVFDWKIEGNVATIQLRAAGGIYPLYVGDQEVHAKFGQSASDGKYPMINTGAGVTATAEPYTYTFPENTEATAKNIPIYVIKDGSTKAYLDASTGKAASKFNTKTTTRWVKEFEDILDAYPDFKGWVANEDLDWTTNKNLDYIY